MSADLAGETVPFREIISARNRRRRELRVVIGDRLRASIAAASIVATIIRDAIMQGYAQFHPGYGFERHKDYRTAEHICVLTRLGPLPFHRRSFAPVWRAGRVQPQADIVGRSAKKPGQIEKWSRCLVNKPSNNPARFAVHVNLGVSRPTCQCNYRWSRLWQGDKWWQSFVWR
jgi:Ribonuclease HII